MVNIWVEKFIIEKQKDLSKVNMGKKLQKRKRRKELLATCND